MSKQQMISCVAWIPRGAAKALPEQYEMADEAVAELAAANAELSIQEDETKFMAPTDDDIDESGAADMEQEQKSNPKQKVLVSKKLAKQKAEKEKTKAKSMGDDNDDSEESDVENPTTDHDEIMRRLKLEEYDDTEESEIDEEDDDDEEGHGGHRFVSGKGLTPYADITQDPNITINVDEEDMEDQRIRNTDSCILVGSTSEGDSSIEVYLFDEKTSNLYVHHEIVLPSFPLCVQWINANPRATMVDSTTGEYFAPTGSFAAVGTFRSGIEIWNCDVMNPVEPVTILGGEEGLVSLTNPVPPKSLVSSKIGKKKGKPVFKASKKLRPGSHTDAVMALAWHPEVPARLASGSADKTVKLWDVTTQQCVYTARHHKDKVQALAWHSEQLDILLTGGYDRRVCVVDTRLSEAEIAKLAPAGMLGADVETVKWNPGNTNEYVATAEDGTVVCRDIRSTNTKEFVWKLKAHEKACTSITFNHALPNIFATSSLDKTVRIWDAAELVDRKDSISIGPAPELLATRDLNVGKLFAMQFDVSNPFILAAGGDQGCLAIWDTLENVRVNERYGKAAEELGLGPQTLPQEFVEFQRAGGLSRGVGPGSEVKSTGGPMDLGDHDDDSDPEADDFGDMEEEQKDVVDDDDE